MTHLTHDIYVDAKIPRGLDDSAQVSLVKKLFFLDLCFEFGLGLIFLILFRCIHKPLVFQNYYRLAKHIEHKLPRMDEFIRK